MMRPAQIVENVGSQRESFYSSVYTGLRAVNEDDTFSECLAKPGRPIVATLIVCSGKTIEELRETKGEVQCYVATDCESIWTAELDYKIKPWRFTVPEMPFTRLARDLIIAAAKHHIMTQDECCWWRIEKGDITEIPVTMW